MRQLISQLQERLEKKKNPETKAWWEAYLKHAIPFRGVSMADIRAELHAWLKSEAIRSQLSEEDQKALSRALIRETYCEDKLAGILFLQEVLVPAGVVSCQQDLPLFATLFQDGYIYEWNTCDWFCVKVLGTLAEREGPACAQVIARWRDAENLWQRRASVVAFANLARKGEANFPGFTDMLLESCAALVRDPQRFAQTGAGWILRELSRAEPERVAAFVSAHVQYLSSEGLGYAIAKLPAETKSHLKKLHKEGKV